MAAVAVRGRRPLRLGLVVALVGCLVLSTLPAFAAAFALPSTALARHRPSHRLTAAASEPAPIAVPVPIAAPAPAPVPVPAPVLAVPQAGQTVLVPVLSAAIGLATGASVLLARHLSLQVDRLRAREPLLAPLLGSAAVASLLLIRPNARLSPLALLGPGSAAAEEAGFAAACLRYVGAVVAVASGNALALSTEAAEFGVALAQQLRRLLVPQPSQPLAPRHVLLLAGAAAGFAMTFDAPLAGLAFALEVAARNLPADANPLAQATGLTLGSVLLASLSAVLLLRRGSFASLAPHMFSRHAFAAWAASATAMTTAGRMGLLGSFAALGVAAGLAAHWVDASLKPQLTRNLAQLPEVVRPLMAGGLGALSVLLLRESQGLLDSFKYLDRLLAAGFGTGPAVSAPKALNYLLFKLAAVLVAAASGLLGSLGGPALFLGGSLGFVLAAARPMAAAPPGPFVMAGAAAFLSGFLRSPITAVVLLFELTRSIELVPPLILASTVATVVSTFLHQRRTQAAAAAATKKVE